MKCKKYLSLFMAAFLAISALPVNAESISSETKAEKIVNDTITSGGAIDTENKITFGKDQIEISSGEYIIPVSMKNASDITKDSMAASCIKGGKIKIAEDGKTAITVDLQAVSVFGVTAWASDWKIYQGNDMSGTPIETESVQDEDGNVTSITFEFPDNNFDGVYVSMFVSAMNTTMEAYFAFDFANVIALKTSYYFGENQTELVPGEYTIPVSMKNANDITKDSMAASCIKGGKIKIAEDGKAAITVNLQAVSVFGVTAWASDWKVYQGDSTSGSAIDAMYTENSDGNTDSIIFELPDNSFDGVYVSMFVSAMNTTMEAYFAFDFETVENKDDTKVYEGTAHVDQFGEYDVNVKVTVKDGKIIGIEITGENFGGTYADINKTKFETAAEGMKNNFIGKDASNADDIYGVDTVSSATISSNAIRDAVMNALSLAIEEEIINIPTEQLEAGEYTVDIAFYSDKVKHSLVENEKAKAVIKVDKNGEDTISVDIINGTAKEPLYVLDFNGYYENNDITNELKKDAIIKKGTIDYDDDVFEKNTPVITNVQFPLEGEYSKIYNTNTKMYVPAMKNLTGEQAGILFDKGVFDTDCFLKIYWDTLELISVIKGFGSAKTELAPGEYILPVRMMNAGDITSPSMAGSCVKDAVLTVNEDDIAKVKINLQPVTLGQISDWASEWKIYQSNSVNGEKINAKENFNTDGKVESIEFDIFDNSLDGVYVNMFVSAMNFSPDAYFVFDYANTKPAEEEIKKTIVDDGTYTADISILKIDSDDISSAQRNFNTEDVSVKVENGKMKISLAFSSNMIEKIEQLKNGEYVDLPITVVNEGKENQSYYAEAELEYLEDIATVQFTINTGTSYGKMVNQARVKINEDSLKPYKEENDKKEAVTYSVPVKMVQANNPAAESMGNSALDGNAAVTIKDGKSIVELNFKAVTISGLYGHLLNIWSYPNADTMNYDDWWDNKEYEIPAEVVQKYMDYGMNYNKGDMSQSEFTKKVSFERDNEKEKSIYIRISVDAMSGFDQAARLDFDWDNAAEINDKPNIIYGDIDNNGVLTASDAAYALAKSLNNDSFITPIDIAYPDYALEYSDVDKNGSITANDASLILQKVLNASVKFPAEE